MVTRSKAMGLFALASGTTLTAIVN